jgi:ABC-type multidrug transport system permease subunit
MPDSTQTVARFLPTTYTLDALHKLMLWGSTDGLWADVAVLAVVALICIVLGTVALSRVRVEW